MFIAPGNAGTAKLGVNLPDIDPADPQEVLSACREYAIDYVFAGTEAPLACGVVDTLLAAGIKTFGAVKEAVKLEGDRSFARDFTNRYHIPIPEHEIISNLQELSSYIETHEGRRFVIKHNGLAPSRIMIDSADPERLKAFGSKLLESDEILIEEHLKGMSVTITLLMDGKDYLLMPVSSDYTKAEEQDTGAPTGGMGSICPVPVISKQVQQQIIDTIVEPTLNGLQNENLTYKGVLLFSIILTSDGPRLVDYHVRFNDPATQAMLPLIKSDFIDLLEAIEENRIRDFNLKISDETAVAVVIASKGYPESPDTGKAVHVPSYAFSNLILSDTIIFTGAVKKTDIGFVTDGGRCFTVVGLGRNILEANEAVYTCLPQIEFEGSWYRKDIGNRFFEE